MKQVILFFAIVLTLACEKSNSSKTGELLGTANTSSYANKPYSLLFNPSNEDSLYFVSLNDENLAVFDTVTISKPLFKVYIEQIDSTWQGSNYDWNVQIDVNGWTQIRKTDNSIVP